MSYLTYGRHARQQNTPDRVTQVSSSPLQRKPLKTIAHSTPKENTKHRIYISSSLPGAGKLSSVVESRHVFTVRHFEVGCFVQKTTLFFFFFVLFSFFNPSVREFPVL
ncbi:hypothetical protein CEXT_677761 [Caerostris extrusa]|uniref:Uncharacterized protein n=1 Tax=Caerostris extrusa TaxID=172846 RepID=A0AAV4N2X4_CAEEX|nr:hypothetical protein CEXT_677761 [Caerostris extrusa]